MNAQESSDVVLLHEAALARGLGFVATVNGVVLVGPAEDPTVLSLTQGISAETNQAAAALLREPDVVRQILESAGVPVPAWRTMRFSDDVDTIAREAARLGFPVMIRPVWPVRRPSAPSLASAVEQPTTLSSAIADIAKSVGVPQGGPVPRRRRFVMEARAGRAELKALVASGEILAVIARPWEQMAGGRWTPVPVDDLHPDVGATLIKAAETVPGIDVLTLSAYLDSPGKSHDDQPFAVAHLDIHPHLATHEQALAGAGKKLASALLESHAAKAGLTLKPQQDQVSIDVLVEGVVLPERDSAHVNEQLRQRSISGSVHPGHGSSVRGTLSASPADLASLVSALTEGTFARIRPRYVEGIPV